MRIFVTGASGLIGGEVAQRLVARGHRVTAGIHRDPAVLANNGSGVAVAGVEAIDLARPLLGLTAPDAARIAAVHDLIIHAAATVRFDLSDAAYRAINVGGTVAVTHLAALADRPILYVGTAYVCGTRDGVIREGDPLPHGGFANGYEASKAAAEALVAAASPRHVVARPSIVVGEHRSGAIRRFEAIYAVLKLIAEGRMATIPARDEALLDLVPIDHVAEALVALAERIDCVAGGRFHLVSGVPVAVPELMAAIASVPGLATPQRVDPARFDINALPGLERYLVTRVFDLYASYLRRAPMFDDSALRAATGLVCPPTDRAFLIRLIDQCIVAGFLSPSARVDSTARAAPARRAPTSSRP